VYKGEDSTEKYIFKESEIDGKGVIVDSFLIAVTLNVLLE
jgi:hypothetical protein